MSLLSTIFLYGKIDSEVEFLWVISHIQGDPICWWEAGLKGGLPFTKAQLYPKLEKMYTAFCLIIWKRQLAGLAGSLCCCPSVLPLLGLTWLPWLTYPISFQSVCRTRVECQPIVLPSERAARRPHKQPLFIPHWPELHFRSTLRRQQGWKDQSLHKQRCVQLR